MYMSVLEYVHVFKCIRKNNTLKKRNKKEIDLHTCTHIKKNINPYHAVYMYIYVLHSSSHLIENKLQDSIYKHEVTSRMENSGS